MQHNSYHRVSKYVYRQPSYPALRQSPNSRAETNNVTVRDQYQATSKYTRYYPTICRSVVCTSKDLIFVYLLKEKLNRSLNGFVLESVSMQVLRGVSKRTLLDGRIFESSVVGFG